MYVLAGGCKGSGCWSSGNGCWSSGGGCCSSGAGCWSSGCGCWFSGDAVWPKMAGNSASYPFNSCSIDKLWIALE